MKGYKGVVLTLAGIVIMLIVSACATADPYAGKWVGYYEPKANVIYLATIEKKKEGHILFLCRINIGKELVKIEPGKPIPNRVPQDR